jgi:hypothetical protein
MSPQVRSDILDWHGDHPATNYHDMYDALRDAGYFLEVLGSPLSCFDAQQVRCTLYSVKEGCNVHAQQLAPVLTSGSCI